MKNLVTLYLEDGDFREAAIDYAADLIGTTSYDFAREWLEFDGSETDQKDDCQLELEKYIEVVDTKNEVIDALKAENERLKESIDAVSRALAYEREG